MKIEHDIIVWDFLAKFDEFYKSDLRNTHVETNEIKMYTRKSKRYLEGMLVDCIDIASITILNEKNRSCGIFTLILDRMLLKYPYDNFFIESIVNPIIKLVTIKFGFITTPESHPLSPDQYLLKTKILFKQ